MCAVINIVQFICNYFLEHRVAFYYNMQLIARHLYTRDANRFIIARLLEYIFYELNYTAISITKYMYCKSMFLFCVQFRQAFLQKRYITCEPLYIIYISLHLHFNLMVNLGGHCTCAPRVCYYEEGILNGGVVVFLIHSQLVPDDPLGPRSLA